VNGNIFVLLFAQKLSTKTSKAVGVDPPW